MDLSESALQIVPASPADGPVLSSIAQHAKAYWGYPAEWLAEWRSQLAWTADDVQRHPTFVARRGDRILGWIAIVLAGDRAILEHLWIDPPAMRQGLGKRLLARAVEEARARGCVAIDIDADPNAESFYVSAGARRIGTVSAPVKGTPRVLPRLELEL